ncbi:LOW QUALITY PROTEIN: uncharacterized protein FYW47_002524 [Aplochiton taeniatus]
MPYGKKASRQRSCDALGNVLLKNLGSWYSCGCYFDTYHLPKHCCRPRTPLHGNGDLKDLLLTYWCQIPRTPSEVLWSPCLDGSELFSSTRVTYTILEAGGVYANSRFEHTQQMKRKKTETLAPGSDDTDHATVAPSRISNATKHDNTIHL